MNCANHPDVPASVFCQFCGKPLCKECARTIGNFVGCEPCIAARLGAAPQDSYTGNVGDSQKSQYAATNPLPPHSLPGTPNPGLAFALGWIPGVGAMYNGQFAKGLVHVLVFAILVSLSDTHGVVGIMIAAWVIYQVFDAYQTAVARRDGLPIPNPLGLNDIGHWVTGQSSSPFATYPGATAASASSPAPSAPEMASAMPPIPPDPYDTPEISHGVPTGAIVLIGIGILFLLGNLGILSSHWLNRAWPLLLIALGVWLLIRRNQSTPPGSTPGPTPGATPGGSL